MICRERAPSGLLREANVSPHICATETINRLFRIADRDKCPTVVFWEKCAEELPLQGVGVLSLINNCQRITRAKLLQQRILRRVCHYFVRASKQIVVAGVRTHGRMHALHTVAQHFHQVVQLLRKLFVERVVVPRLDIWVAKHLRYQLGYRPFIPHAASKCLNDHLVVYSFGNDSFSDVVIPIGDNLDASGLEHFCTHAVNC